MDKYLDMKHITITNNFEDYYLHLHSFSCFCIFLVILYLYCSTSKKSPVILLEFGY